MEWKNKNLEKGHGIIGYNPFTAVKWDPSVRMHSDREFGNIVLLAFVETLRC